VTEVKRFVSYVYLYNQGVRENNVGFAKVDSRNGQCKITVNIKGLEQSNGKCEKVYLFYRRKEKLYGIGIGSFQIVNGIGEFRDQVQTQNIKGTKLSLDDMNGILVREEDRNEKVFASGWDDDPISMEQFYLHKEETQSPSVADGKEIQLHAFEMNEISKEPVIYFDQSWKEESAFMEQNTKENLSEEKPKRKEQTKEQEKEEQTKEQEKREQRKEQEKKEQRKEQEKKEQRKERQMEEQIEKRIEEKQRKEKPIEKEASKSGQGLNIDQKQSGKSMQDRKEEKNAKEIKAESDTKMQGFEFLWNNDSLEEEQEMVWQEYQEEPYCLMNKNQIINQKAQQYNSIPALQETQKSTPIQTEKKQNEIQQDQILDVQDNLQQEEQTSFEEQQEQEETLWEKLCHQFPKIRAFVDEPESLCLKIDLRDLRLLPSENWVLGNNSFLLHGYYNFRYLILTQQKEDFILGIPGIYHPNEKVMASMFGFQEFKPVKACDKMLGQFGYWYRKVIL